MRQMLPVSDPFGSPKEGTGDELPRPQTKPPAQTPPVAPSLGCGEAAPPEQKKEGPQGP